MQWNWLTVQTCVVSVPHPTMGQEPVAVVAYLDSVRRKEDVQSHVVQTFGRDYSLRAVVSLQEIGMDRFPVNSTHKVVKQVVEQAVRKNLQV